MKNILYLLALTIPPIVSCSKQDITPFTYEQICKAAISASVSTKPRKMKSISSKSGAYEISYIRNDGNKYTYDCKFKGNEVRWKDSSMSKWNKNVKIYFKINKDRKLHIKTDMLGTVFTKTFKTSDF